jgi:RNA polymerase sigma factor (sigma-70 family)
VAQRGPRDWDIGQWKKALDASGSPEEQEAYQELAKNLLPAARKLLGSKYYSEKFLQRNAYSSIEELAEEFVQQTLVKVYENYARFQWKSHIKTYAISILHHEILQEIRRSRTNEIPVIFEPDDEDIEDDPYSFIATTLAPPLGHSPEEIMEQKESHQQLEQALNQLGEAHRQAIDLHIIQGKPIHLAAKEMGISVVAFYKTLSRAKQKLRFLLNTSFAAQDEFFDR